MFWAIVRFPYEISCFVAVMRCPFEICCVFAAYFHYEISCFLAVVICPCGILCFLLHNFRSRYPDEMSCFFEPLRALRKRLHALLALMRFPYDVPCFLTAEYSF